VDRRHHHHGLGLGYTVANSRRDRIDVINQQAEGEPGSAE